MPKGDRTSCTIIGGPNGSGKSTIFQLLKPQGVFINADIVARRLSPRSPESVSIIAGREILATIDKVTASGISFVYETTLSSHQSVSLMESCRSLGYEINLVFVALASVDLNVRRVAERVSRGGHGIPEATIRRRFDASFRRLPAAIKLSDSCLFFDNSHLRPKMLLMIENGTISQSNLDKASVLDTRIAGAVAEAFGIGHDAVFSASRSR